MTETHYELEWFNAAEDQWELRGRFLFERDARETRLEYLNMFPGQIYRITIVKKKEIQ